MSQSADSWFPLFEFTSFLYRSYLLLPADSNPSGPVTMKDWARGDFQCGQAFREGDNYGLQGKLIFRPGVYLEVKASGQLGRGAAPATFEASGEGTEGPTAGTLYRLDGLVHPIPPLSSGAARVGSIRGSVKAVRGLPESPEVELGGAPVRTVGAFVIVSLGPSS